MTLKNMETRVKELSRDLASVPEGTLPKYLILRAKLMELIENGVWKAGDKLPTEADLAKHLPVSLGTIQKAYSALSEEGVIGRRRGLGTFVQQRNQMVGPMHCRFAGDDGEVLPIYPTVRSLFRFAAKKPLADVFGGEDDLMRIDREIFVNKEFTLWNRFYIPFRDAQPLLKLPQDDLGHANFKTILGAEPRTIVHKIDQKIWPGVPELHTAAEPEVVKSTAFTLEARALTRNGETIYLLEILIPRTHRPLLSTIMVY